MERNNCSGSRGPALCIIISDFEISETITKDVIAKNPEENHMPQVTVHDDFQRGQQERRYMRQRRTLTCVAGKEESLHVCQVNVHHFL